MKISISHYGVTHTVETQNDDLTSMEVLEYCIGLIRSAGWQESTIQDTVIELADGFNDDKIKDGQYE